MRFPMPVSRRLVFTFCFSLVATSALAQATATTPFEPQVGQPGKDVVWVPTPQELVDRILDLAKVTPKDYLVDLGSGDGRTVITAAKRGTTALGIEYNPDMVELSIKNAAAAGVTDRAKFMKADIFQTDFSKATVLTLFLLPSLNVQLRPTILNMKPGTRVVSNTFSMEDWRADETSEVGDPCERWCTALFWIVPAKVEGAWRTGNGALTLKQQFQELTGTLGTAEIVNGRMRGEEILFTAGGANYTGRVSGDRMEGSVVSGGRTTTWQATRAGR